VIDSIPNLDEAGIAARDRDLRLLSIDSASLPSRTTLRRAS
jgi:hypothetical protein